MSRFHRNDTDRSTATVTLVGAWPSDVVDVDDDAFARAIAAAREAERAPLAELRNIA
jgi:hypothetical protein